MKTKNSLKEKWNSFINAFFAPVPIFSLIGAGILIFLSIKYKDSVSFSVLINIIGSLLIGIAGAFIKGRYDELINESVLIKKGQSAIRNLDSIGQQVIQIRDWIKSFISKKESKRALEEVDRHLRTTEMNIRSGLQDWTDIIPELQETEGMTKAYESTIKKYFEELWKNKKELLEAGENKELREKLEKRIKELEENVKKSKKEQPRIFSGGGLSSFVIRPDSFVSMGGGVFGELNNKICSECGKAYYDDNLLAISAFSRDICPDCKKKLGL